MPEPPERPTHTRLDFRWHENEVAPVFTPSSRAPVYQNRAHCIFFFITSLYCAALPRKPSIQNVPDSYTQRGKTYFPLAVAQTTHQTHISISSKIVHLPLTIGPQSQQQWPDSGTLYMPHPNICRLSQAFYAQLSVGNIRSRSPHPRKWRQGIFLLRCQAVNRRTWDMLRGGKKNHVTQIIAVL